jgi:hypothetical protein
MAISNPKAIELSKQKKEDVTRRNIMRWHSLGMAFIGDRQTMSFIQLPLPHSTHYLHHETS